MISLRKAALVFVLLFTAWAVLAGMPANGALHVSSENPRYFTDANGKPVFLTGSHTWGNFQDYRYATLPSPAPMDFDAHLRFLEQHHHNFFRLWVWESALNPGAKQGTIHYDPMPYERPGPGPALDGKPRFDLTRFNAAYFERLRTRVKAAGDRGIYVSVMLFNGFSVEGKGNVGGDPWQGHPFNPKNNLNGLDGVSGLATHTLSNLAATAFQEAYVRKVIDTVNDLDNVLYEISNEDTASPADTAWQFYFIRFVQRYEATKPRQHPVGMTAQWPGNDEVLYQSPADWISPAARLPAGDGRKIILNDTDHSYFWTGLKQDGPAAQRAWVWENFTRGNQCLFMDPYLDPSHDPGRNAPVDGKPDPYWDSLRQALDLTRRYAGRMHLGTVIPHAELASTSFCLADPGKEYLVYQSKPGEAVALELKAGIYRYEWFNPSTGSTAETGRIEVSDGKLEFKAPFEGESVLYLKVERSARRLTVYAWFPAHFGSWKTDDIDWDFLTHLCFRSVELAADGTIRRVSGNPPKDFVETAHRNWVKVTVLVWTRSRAESDSYLARFPQEAANNLLAYVKENNLDGVNIDDEQMGAINTVAHLPNRELVTRFFQILAKTFKAANPSYHVTFAAPPVIDAKDRFGTEWLDLKGIAEVVDGIIPMGYTQNPPSAGWTTNPEPLGGGGRAAWTTTRDIQTMVRDYLDAMDGHKEKLLVGVSLKFGGYEWRCRTERPLAPILNKGTWRSLEECEAKAREHGARWDEQQKSSWYCYPDGDAFVQGWFNDARTWQAKLDWIGEQGLGGLGIWVLDGVNDPPGTWELLRRYSSLQASQSQ